ncbi:OmpA family protein [Reichenbachiella faecimaris]|uniref:OmpA family protein n=1 Tax=Reichenbachiella faecimaris TaxID=692418 RepID=A0A1W2GHS9_REIFA|nr:OmpA family protein [Reichenbachiella faecimaris]
MVLTLFVSMAFGQDVEKLEKKAQKYFYAEELVEAAQVYEEILGIDSQNKMAAYRLIICRALLNPRSTSMEDLLQYKSTQGKRDKFYYYWLGRAYFHQNQFKKAAESWNKFLTLDKYKSSVIIAEAKFFIDWAERAEVHHSFSKNYEIDQLPEPINSTSTEYSPVFFSELNELLFLSDRSDENESKPFNVYHSIRTGTQWSTPSILSYFGSFDEANANIEVVNKSSKLYLYQGEKKGSLFVSHSDNSKWSKPVSLSREVSSSKLESHFFINEQENIMLFAHRKKGKTADLDIFVSRLDPSSNHWSKPALLSTDLTTDLDEDYPYLSTDGKTLYFSSKGFGSIGGYDVFKSEFNAEINAWSAPVSLGYPTNSIGHDIQFKMDAPRNSGYFVSDRLSSYGSFDIYFFHESNKILLTGQIVDAAGLPADHAEIHFYPSRRSGLELKTMTDENGNYEVKVGSEDNINVEILFHDHLVHKESVQTPRAEQKVMKKNFAISTEKGQADDSSDYYDPTYTDLENIGSKFRLSNKALLSNIYFDFDEFKLDEEDRAQLKPLLAVMKENKELRVEIAGHTDNIGDGKANLRISILRAKAVANYLIGKGIASSRVEPRGYGYAIPMATNDQEKEGREFNRRIEVLVLE